jgi:hypothetical protein
MKKYIIHIILFLVLILTIINFSFWFYTKKETKILSRAIGEGATLNLVYNDTYGALQAVNVGRGSLTAQSGNLSPTAIWNSVYNNTTAALQIILSDDSSDIPFLDITGSLAMYDYLQYDSGEAVWENTQTPTVANNQWMRWRNYADSGFINGFRVNTSDLIEAGTTLRLLNDTWLAGRNYADSADVNVFRVNTSNLIEAGTTLVMPNNTWLKWRNADDSANVTGFKIYSSTNIIDVGANMHLDDFAQGALNRWATSESVLDEGSITTLAAINAPGFGLVTANDGAEYCLFIFSADGGTITLAANSANCVATDTDAKLCVIDSGGAGIHFKNRLGSTQTVKAWVQY